jgi:hypothetical protein
MRDVLPIRPTYTATAAVEYHATIACRGKHIIRCERVTSETARRTGLPVTHVADVDQWWLVSLIGPSGLPVYLAAEPCETVRQAEA